MYAEWECKAVIADILLVRVQDSVQRAVAFNVSHRRRHAATSLLAGSSAATPPSGRASPAPALENGHATEGEVIGGSDESGKSPSWSVQQTRVSRSVQW